MRKAIMFVKEGGMWGYRNGRPGGDCIVPSEFCLDVNAPSPVWTFLPIEGLDLYPGWYERNYKAEAAGFPPHWRKCFKCKQYSDPTTTEMDYQARRGRFYHGMCIEHRGAWQ